MSNERVLHFWRTSYHAFQMATTERLGHARGRLHECSPKGERAGASESNDPSKLGLAAIKQKSGKPACRVFSLPHSHRECTHGLKFSSVFSVVNFDFVF